MTNTAEKCADLFASINDPKKRRIMEAALVEFAKSGFHGTSTRDIARCAGIANGLIYYHYKDKEELYLALCRYVREQIFVRIMGAFDEWADIFEAIMESCRRKQLFSAEYPDAYQLLLDEARYSPGDFKADGYNLKRNTIWPWESDAKLNMRQKLMFEILKSALDGLGQNFFERYRMGEISADDMMEQGMASAKSYIDFFKKMWDS